MSNTYSDKKGNTFTAAEFSAMVTSGQLRGTPYADQKTANAMIPILRNFGIDVKVDRKTGNVGFWMNTASCVFSGNKLTEIKYTNTFVPIILSSINNKSEPWLTINFNRGIIQIETNFTDKNWGAITPGSFIIYPKGGSKDPYYNTHEPGHVVQFYIPGPLKYYIFVAIPSLISSTTPYHRVMPWEMTANQIWYWLTGENDPSKPLYFKPKKR